MNIRKLSKLIYNHIEYRCAHIAIYVKSCLWDYKIVNCNSKDEAKKDRKLEELFKYA